MGALIHCMIYHHTTTLDSGGIHIDTYGGDGRKCDSHVPSGTNLLAFGLYAAVVLQLIRARQVSQDKMHTLVGTVLYWCCVGHCACSQPGGEAWLVLPSAAAEEYGLSAIGFYVSKGLMSKVSGTGARLATF